VFVALVSAVAFVVYFTRINITVAGRYVRDDLGLGQEGLGGILGAFMFGYVVGMLPSGWLTDRIGPRRTLRWATLCWVLLTLLTAVASWEVVARTCEPGAFLMLTRFLLGVSQACAFPAFARAVGNWVRRGERGLAVGLVQSAAFLGGAMTPLVIQPIVTALGWRESFVASAAVAAVVAGAWWAVATDAPRDQPRMSSEDMPLEPGQDNPAPRPAGRADLRRLFQARSAYALCLAQFCFGAAGFVFFSWFYTYFVEQRHAAESTAALLQASAYLAMTVGATVGGYLCDRAAARWAGPWGRRAVPLAVIVLAGICGMVAPAIRSNYVAGGVFAAGAGLLCAATPCVWAAILDLAPRTTGTLGAMSNGANWLGTALGTRYFPAMVSLLQSWGAHAPWDATFQLAGAIGVAGGLLWLLVDASKPVDAGDAPVCPARSVVAVSAAD
jgi:ACS family glucarate transporter-like MFS transporter